MSDRKSPAARYSAPAITLPAQNHGGAPHRAADRCGDPAGTPADSPDAPLLWDETGELSLADLSGPDDRVAEDVRRPRPLTSEPATGGAVPLTSERPLAAEPPLTAESVLEAG
ncbi:hypothetical protein [Streptomyces aidingensis]|uniref:Uncharacterized protein n=1 Tax=Streptomyces aidingensis TaxID=910347 RepID=A0A1I1FBQ7_9ACTN|nr:hypothetical protein [Streptomyces aidingensis]SFB96724.1 hypothetical protein SAMN05421773_101671 [Streptomyces aidingensis]